MIEQRILFDTTDPVVLVAMGETELAEQLLIYGDSTVPSPIGILGDLSPVKPKHKEIVCVKCDGGSVRGTLYKTGDSQYEHDHGKAKRNWKRAKWVLR